MCGKIFWRPGTGGIFARTRPIFSRGRDAKMRPVPLVGRAKGTGRFFASHFTTDSNSRARKSPPSPAIGPPENLAAHGRRRRLPPRSRRATIGVAFRPAQQHSPGARPWLRRPFPTTRPVKRLSIAAASWPGRPPLGLAIVKPELVTGAQANSKIRLGLIGCGGRGNWIANLFKPARRLPVRRHAPTTSRTGRRRPPSA